MAAVDLAVGLQNLDEGIWWDRNAADKFHLLFALLLFVEELALAADVTAIALRSDVLAHFADVVAGDDLAADGGLYRDLEHLRRDDVGELLAQRPALAFGLAAVHDTGKGVDRVLVDEDVHLHEVRGAVLAQFVIHGT